MILSSFFWGYIVTQIPSGYFITTVGAQKLFCLGIFMCSILNLLIPLLAIYYGWIAVIGCRIGAGLFQGCVFPCVQTLLSRWVPPGERARLGEFITTSCIFLN
jgi:ACS family sodium-dependent inorganic phosphate cotransporter-like MFS transporter 5